jgi:hypothetical protein
MDEKEKEFAEYIVRRLREEHQCILGLTSEDVFNQKEVVQAWKQMKRTGLYIAGLLVVALLAGFEFIKAQFFK